MVYRMFYGSSVDVVARGAGAAHRACICGRVFSGAIGNIAAASNKGSPSTSFRSSSTRAHPYRLVEDEPSAPVAASFGPRSLNCAGNLSVAAMSCVMFCAVSVREADAFSSFRACTKATV
eukprot:gnl/Chilomastix_cuspidata/6755.p2 GENE.gnl/Chilomastix_cuspidata/6755~~gnl/Chilomastix_cuspidata/6755.p2  ORF type:complete len:120 (-),score=21.44 gnl/Chilomastix_cuspidata/6755:168-527(-)